MVVRTGEASTVNGAKHLTRLVKHWSHKFETELTEGRGVVRFPAAVAAFEATPEGLRIRIEAEDAGTAERMTGVVARHLDRFAFREAPLPFSWQG
jgi:hypothetical protein